jgi:3-deoxy-7-phosphoheptulonate synthase
MIIVLRPDAAPEAAQQILERIEAAGLKPLHMPGSERVVLGALGDERVLAELQLESDPRVESVKPILAPYKLVSRELHPHDTIVRIGGMAIGGGRFEVIAGPCAVETRDQLRNTALAVKAASRGPAPTAFRATARPASSCSAKWATRPGCRSSPK